MGTTIYKPRTVEGKKMYENLSKYSKLKKGESLLPPVLKLPIQTRTLPELQVEFFISELQELVENSKNVVLDCQEMLALCTTQDEYLKNDCKVALLIHSRLVIRYTRLLNWETAFEKV